MAAYTTIDNPELYFQTKIYTGNGTAIGSGGQAITLDGDENMQPDFVWIKERNNSTNHQVYDSVRGATKRIYSDGNYVEDTQTEGLTTFGSDGFTVGNDGSTNGSSDTYAAWCWKESADAGFDIVTFSGSDSNQNVSHSLSAVPQVVIVKCRTAVGEWMFGHHSNTWANRMKLNTADADGSYNWMNSGTSPTSSVFTLTGNVQDFNDNGQTYVAYVFTGKQGFSSMGSYIGNGSTDGPFVFCGFRPAWILYKRTTDGTEGWILQDNKRSPFNVSHVWLDPQSTGAESDSTNANLDFLSNGFKLRHDDTRGNTSGKTYIYMAFAESPFVNSNGVPTNAR
jgi:hypothetical protein